MDQPGKTQVDFKMARRLRPYTLSEYLARILWALATPLFRLSPRLMYGWRRGLLRAFGAQVGAEVHIDPTAQVALPWMLKIGQGASVGPRVLIYNLGMVSLGARTTVSHGAHLCAGTHDYSLASMPLQREPITIGSDAWVCAEAFIGPACTVGDGSVVAARAVVVRDVPPWSIVAGNPATVKGRRDLTNV